MRRYTRPRAFTMMEMIVTLVLLFILVAIAAMFSRSMLNRGFDADAAERMRRAMAVQQVLGRDFGSYSNYPADLAEAGNDLAFVTGVSRKPNQVSIAVGSAGTFGAAVRSASGRCVMWQVAPLEAGGNFTELSTDGQQSRPCAGAEALPEDETALPSATVRFYS